MTPGIENPLLTEHRGLRESLKRSLSNLFQPTSCAFVIFVFTRIPTAACTNLSATPQETFSHYYNCDSKFESKVKVRTSANWRKHFEKPFLIQPDVGRMRDWATFYGNTIVSCRERSMLRCFVLVIREIGLSCYGGCSCIWWIYGAFTNQPNLQKPYGTFLI